ncbi:M23 family metallopeptidase [Nocardioides ganghwensis]|jgi:murein DD-endopeptidase MepM/ murein hydrolase activator NlpD|uniref:M23 family metallopeptidase n=1 Tax=Nocardioides ganghwensis TaxID=252230 RepID=A0A4Q2S5N2_9ACTN|nr:M23 family metallopeptidase [Nocardioides ganghwensis]MBD3948043.1 M23 family metallopeptidase [Nocardioides ganghwensis]RYB97345.1 M23 family metallopeptidase [Nocardioides ganghwensis]
MSSMLQRAGMAVAAAAAALALAAPSAHAAPEVTVREDGRQLEAIELARQVAERQQRLASLNRRADARDRALVGRKELLARYGYRGDPDTVRVVLPMASYDISAGFGLTGPLWEAEHGGQDFSAGAGEPLVAVAGGVVTEVAYAGPYGLRTILELPDGTEVWYCHQTDATVAVGQRVEVADVIGSVGSTGNSTGPHLHLEVRPAGGSPVDPMDWLRAAGLTP